MWPSEGAVSDAAAGLAREAGFSWLASDDGLLGHSLGKAGDGFGPVPAARKFSAYRLGSAGPAFFFRDHGLSDLIGFTYARWRPEDAAADFLNRLSEIQAALPDDGRHRVVPVILDGENAWEHYPDNGIGFLGGLYRGLVESPHLRPVTFSEYLALEAHREPLATLAAGSWIGGNLTTWIGHPEKNRAWELLAAARAFLAARLGGAPDPAVEPAAREMLIAEGSDWFWWYGDDHASENAAEFDALFRSHVKNVYRLAGGVEPPELDLPIKRLAAHTPFRTPVRTLSPRIDGRVTDYFEWLAAGHALASRGGSMHRSERVLEAVYFGYDRRRLYLRLDAAAGPGGFPAGSSVRVRIVGPRQLDLRLEPGPDGPWRARWEGAALAAPEFAGDRILELAIPLDDLGLAGPGELRFFVTVEAGERELERFPASDVLVVPVDPGGLDPSEWVV
jgi:hypothetical protein